MANWSSVIDSAEDEGAPESPAGDERDERDDRAVEQRRERVDERGRPVSGTTVRARTQGRGGRGAGGARQEPGRRQT